jgi:hypothetical protein
MAERSKSSVGEGKQAIEWSAVKFPSDGVTLGQLRESFVTDRQAFEVELHNLLSLEMEIANDVLSLIMHTAQPSTGMVGRLLKEEKARELVALYLHVGLAAGLQEAKQMVADLEQSVARTAGHQSPG